MRREWIGSTALATTLVSSVCVLSACGGGGGGSNIPGTNNPATAQAAAACAVTQTGPFVAVSLTGQVGQAQFSNGGAVLTYGSYPSSFSNNSLSGSLNLVKDPNNPGVCMDQGGATASMRTVLQSNGVIGISHAMVNGADEPVVLLAQSALAANTSLASLAGTYDLLRYQTDSTGGGQTRSSYVTFTVDSTGGWSMCKNAPSCSTPTATGTFGALPGNASEFEFSSGGLVRGNSFIVNDGSTQILVTAEHDTGSGLVQGLHFGMAQAPWNPLSGPYATNTTDGVAAQTIVYGSAVGAAGKTPIALTTNSPVPGLATALAADGTTVNYLIDTPSGLFVDASNTGNNFAGGPGFFAFGIIPPSN